MLPFTHKLRHSEPPDDHMQGALLAGMVVPLQKSATQQMVVGRFARREALQMGHTCVAALANGTTIGCAQRLGLPHLQDFCDMTCG